MSLLYDPRKRRWLGFGALALVFLLVNLHRLSTAVLSEELTVDFAISASQLGALHAAFFVIYAVVQIPTGVLADRFGPRDVGASGAVVLSVGALVFATGDSYLVAFAGRVLVGLGSGVIFISILRYCANWYRIDEFATMTGVTGAIAGLGAIFATTPLAIAVGAIGWRPAITGLGVVGIAAGVAVFAVVRRSPDDANLEPIAHVPEQSNVTFAQSMGHLRVLLRDLDQWLLSVILFSAMGTLLTIIGLWGVPYLVVVYGLDVTTASTYTLLGSVGMLIGTPAIGWFSDRIGRRYLPLVLGMGLYVCTLAIIPVFGQPPLATVAGAYFLIGFSLGFLMLTMAIIKEKYPAEASGVATATINGAGFLGATVLPWLMGVALDRYRTDDVVAGVVVYTEFGYRLAFAIVTVGVGLSLLASVWLFVRERRRHRP